jgi:hypothetical protein
LTSTAPPPAPAYRAPSRPRPVRAYNALAHRTRLPPASLDPDALLAAARRRTGLHDLGEPDHGEPLRLLAGSFADEANLTPFGRVLIARLLRNDLERRLRVVDAHARHPELRTLPVRRPVFVVGLPRTGTTLLYNLLAQAPDARPLLGWEAFDPLAPRRAGGPDLRRPAYRAILAGLYRHTPELRKVHAFAQDGPQECLQLLSRSFASFAYLLLADLPSYERWLWTQPQEAFAPTYRLHRAQLQLLQAARPGGRWLLKSPAHLPTVEALLGVYPDACIVQTHRDLGEVLGSNCSMFATVNGIFSDAVDPAALGRTLLARNARILDRVVEARRRLPVERVVDVHYRDLMDDPSGVVRKVWGHFGADLPAESERRTARYLADNPAGKHGRHHYCLAQFGLDQAQVDAAAARYHERFRREGPQ